MHNFIYALGINQVGLANAGLLCRKFGYDIDKIINAAFEDLLEIDGFGETIAQSIVNYFNDEENVSRIKTALSFLDLQKPEAAEVLKLEGKTFVITGETVIYKNRSELQTEIERNGGKVTSSVTAKTAFLINNDITSTSSKNKKAAELGIPLITEEEFVKMI